MRRFLCILCCCLLLAVLPPTAWAAGLTASVSAEPVTLNGVKVDNRQAKYPLLVYRDITYFPMTYHLCRFLGVSSGWDGTTLSIDRTGETAEYTAETSAARQKGSVAVSRVTYSVVINGTEFDSKSAKWPLLNYRDVTYFPLTWALAVEELGWDYQWDAKNGLRIDSTAESGGPPMGDGEIMNSATRGFAPSVWGLDPGELTVELWNDWTVDGIKEAIRKGMADYVAAQGQEAYFLDGGPSAIRLSYNVQFPAQAQSGTELQVPFTAVFSGHPVTLPSGNTFTPTGETSELTATVRLCGPGELSVDSGFQTGQAMYQRLKACTETGEISVQANTTFDGLKLIQAAVGRKLDAAGLSDQYNIRAVSLGTYTSILGAGKTETVDFTIDFVSKSDSAPANDVRISGQAVFRAQS